MKDKETTEETVVESKRVNEGFCCRCTRRKEKKCSVTNAYVARKHRCTAKIDGKKAFKYKD